MKLLRRVWWAATGLTYGRHTPGPGSWSMTGTPRGVRR